MNLIIDIWLILGCVFSLLTIIMFGTFIKNTKNKIVYRFYPNFILLFMSTMLSLMLLIVGCGLQGMKRAYINSINGYNPYIIKVKNITVNDSIVKSDTLYMYNIKK